MTNNHLGGTYLKTGILKNGARVRCIAMGRNGGTRIVPERTTDQGRFGPALEIPTEIEGQDFVVSIPADKGDGKVLRTAWGDDFASWQGKTFDVYESTVLDRIRVVIAP